MTAEIDIWRTAHFHLKRYGDDAAREAIERADALARAGDTISETLWRRVAAAIEELRLSKKPSALN
jgi:hypothetical protein